MLKLLIFETFCTFYAPPIVCKCAYNTLMLCEDQTNILIINATVISFVDFCLSLRRNFGLFELKLGVEFK